MLRLDDPPGRTGVLRGERSAGLIVARTLDERSRRFRALVDRHFEFVWRSVRRLGVPPGDADDAAQEVFVVAARKLDALEPERERSFLFGTAVRVASTRRRTR